MQKSGSEFRNRAQKIGLDLVHKKSRRSITKGNLKEQEKTIPHETIVHEKPFCPPDSMNGQIKDN